MKTIKLDPSAGSQFGNVAKQALATSLKEKTIVEFEFNGIQCLVNKFTNLDWLYRDYSNAHTMDWQHVGPNCVAEYSEFEKSTLKQAMKQQEMARQKQLKKQKENDEAKLVSFESTTAGEKMQFSDEAGWKESRKVNTDPYGGGVLDFAERWALLMQVEMSKGKTLIECAGPTSERADIGGITGFMYGAAVSTLVHCWKHGEELRKWHNKEYDQEGDGVVNPAVINH